MMVRRASMMDRTLVLALWITALVAAPLAMVDAVTLDPTQALVLQDSAWGKTFAGWTDANPDCSTTTGVTCDGSGMITKLEIAYTPITGSIPASISDLRKLQVLRLPRAQVTGSVPDGITLLTDLIHLNLYGNQLTGSLPEGFGSLSNLRQLYIYTNNFTGPIPSTIGLLRYLDALYLTETQLSGPIPDSIGWLQGVTTMVLASNKLSGSIPATITNMTSLYNLYLNDNQLNGSIPIELFTHPRLMSLNIEKNQLSGSIPTPVPPYGILRHLSFGQNQLTGSIPAKFAILTTINTLDLSFNQLSGSIPADLSALGNLWSLDLSHNQLTDTIPAALSTLRNLDHLILSNNQLSSSIPTEFTALLLQRVYLAGNQLTGSFDVFTGYGSYVREIDLSNNLLSGSIPAGLSDLYLLENLDLSSNQFEGSIPASISEIISLTTLSLHNNRFIDTIPSTFSALTDLNSLNLASNALSDSIPSELSTLTKLTYLDLRQNQLTGTFPESLSTLTNLQELWLEKNQLTQSLPSAIGNLANLRNISLANNNLYGRIPDSVTSLTKLITYDLSHNYFTGGLVKPANVLAVLSYNYLSGTLPAKPTDLLDSNCFKLAAGETEPVQRTQSVCRAFCGISMGSAAGGCSGHGVLCYPDGPNLVPTCVCEAGFYTFRRTYCLAAESVLAAPLEKAILPPSTVLTAGLKAEAKGLFTAARVPLFVYQNGQQDPGCGFELAFSVNFTFVLSPKAKAASNGFAFVVSTTNTVGTNAGVGFGGMDNRSMAIEFDVLQNKPHNDMKDPHVGLNINGQDTSIAAVKSPFLLTNKKPYTAWVDYVPGDPGTIQVFLATTAVKPVKPLLDRRLSLCAVLQPGPPQGEGMPEQPRAFYFGFVASTTVKPFMIQAITSSYLRTDAPPARGPVNITPAYGLDVSLNTYVPTRASPFPRYVSADYRVSAGQKDSWVFRDLHSWDAVPFLGWPVKDQKDCNACWAYAVVSSIEAAYGIATNQEAPVISVDSLFTAMNLTTQAAKCTAGGSPTEAFEKLMALPAGAITMEGNKKITFPVQGFERTAFKGYVGLMLAVQRQPVVVHVEALAASFAKYDGTFKYQDPACYTGNLNHVVLVIGYLVLRNDGSENRIAPPFWIIRNSWGEAWGDRGHMRMDMQGGDGVCGINVLPGIYPIVKIPGDPCGFNSYKGDGDLQPSMNPCGRFTCTPFPKTNNNTCACTLPAPQTKQPFVEAANGYGNTCVYVDVCGSYFKNPCAVGTCINDGKGSYSCICPLNYVNSTTIDKFPTCDPANTTAINLVVTGDNWLCSDIYPLVGLTLSQFTTQNPTVVCTKALPKGRRLRFVDTPAIPCTAYFYTLSGDTCLSIAKSLRTSVNDLMNLNPGLDCTQTIKAGRSICVERNDTYAYTVPECVKYTILTADDTCEKMLQGQGLQNDPSVWAELYRNNPGLLCSNVVPSSASAVGSNAGVEVCLKAEYWPFELGKCTKGRPKNVSPSLSCSAVYSYYGGTMTQAAADFNTYNGNACAKNVGAKFICVPR
ncbi:unnamed protein product [Closterium sp. Yama58-4]|nr:unnamed protein product [Closterium sp. Yama58-4]